MFVQTSAAQIGRYGWTHYTGEPTDSGHECRLVPQSIADGWEALCSCGEWRAFENFYAIPGKNALLAALQEAHAAHAQAFENTGL